MYTQGLEALQGLDDGARHAADVGAPMAPDLGLVAHAAQRYAVELSLEGFGHGTAQGGLSHLEFDSKMASRGLKQA